MSTRIIDFHCDTVGRLVGEGADLTRRLDHGHVDLPRLRQGGVGCQVFACCATRLEFGDRVVAQAEAMLDAVAALAHLPGVVLPRTAAELAALRDDAESVGVLVAVEGGDALEGRVDRLADFHARGVRYLTLAWNDNELTGSAFGSGSGLTAAGRDVIRAMDQLGMLVDVSHMSDQAFDDTLRTAQGTLIASHSGCRALCASPRNLTDDQIRAIAERGGVVGMVFAPGFLSEATRQAEAPVMERMMARVRREGCTFREAMADLGPELAGLPLPDSEDIVRHLEHLVQVGGIECAAFGSDFDGIPATPVDVPDCTGFGVLLERLRQRGFGDAELERICWDNWARVLEATFTS